MLQENKNTSVESKQKKTSATVNVAKIDPETPIPLSFGGDYFTLMTGKRYLPFLDGLDNYPNMMWQARLNSTTQNACITSIAQTCVGNGIYVKNLDENKVDKDFLKFIAKINSEESLNDILRAGIESEGTDGNAWAEIVKGSVGGTKYVKAYMHTSLVCRLSVPPKDKDKPESVIRSVKFAEHRNRILSSNQLKSVVIPLYNDNPLDKNKVWLKVGSGDMSTMIHLKNKFPGVLHYGIQRSAAGYRSQLLEAKHSQYNIDLLDNGMVLSALVVFKSPMTKEEAQANAQEIIKTHTGGGKNGRVAVISSESGIEDTQIETLQTQKEGSYIEQDKRIEQKIITSNGWDSIFFGMGDQATLGKGSGYVRAVYDIKKTTVIDPITNYWLTSFVKPLIDIAADHLGKPEWKNYELGFRSAMPFSYSSDIDVNAVVTKNEGREILGFAKSKNPDWDIEPIKGGSAPAEEPENNNDPAKKEKEEEDVQD